MIEYGLILALVAVVVIGALLSFSGEVGALYFNVVLEEIINYIAGVL